MEDLQFVLAAFNTLAKEGDPLRDWLSSLRNPEEELGHIAESIGRAFLDRRLSYDTASALLNQLMPRIGFEAAPVRFWEVYVAFEDAETAQDPERDAMVRVEALLGSAGNRHRAEA